MELANYMNQVNSLISQAIAPRAHIVSMGVEQAEAVIAAPVKPDPAAISAAVMREEADTVRDILETLADAQQARNEMADELVRAACMGHDEKYLKVQRAEADRIYEERLRIAARRVHLMFKARA